MREFTTIPGGRVVRRSGGGLVGEIYIKANSAQFQLKFPTGAELGNINLEKQRKLRAAKVLL